MKQYRRRSGLLKLCGVLVPLALTLLLLPQAVWAGSYDPGDGRLPIWWSDSLELESLDQVEERLAEPFEGGGSFSFKTSKGKLLSAQSCKELLGAVPYPTVADESGWLSPLAAYYLHQDCWFFLALKQAAPSQGSQIPRSIDADWLLNRLPLWARLWSGISDSCRLLLSGEGQSRWADLPEDGDQLVGLAKEKKHVRLADQELHFSLGDLDYAINLLARADFDLDGWEDLALRIGNWPKDAKGNQAILLLRFDSPLDQLTVINSDYLARGGEFCLIEP